MPKRLMFIEEALRRSKGTVKKIRIKSFILREEEPIGEITPEEFEKLEEVPKEEMEENFVALHVPPLRMEMDTNIVEVKCSEEDFNRLCHVFKLYGIRFKPIENDIEIDIREKDA